MSVRINTQYYVDATPDGIIDFTQYATPETFGLDAGTNYDIVTIDTTGNMKSKGSITLAKNSNEVTIAASSSLADTYTITLPEDAPATGDVMKHNGTGLEWSPVYSDPTTTAGDLVIRNGSNTLTRLPIGTAGQVLKVSSGAPAWADNNQNSADMCLFDDFCGVTSPFGDYPWVLVSTGTVSSTLAFPTSSSNVIGCAAYSLTLAADTFGLRRNLTTGTYFGTATIVFEAGINIATLSGVSNSYIYRIGFGDVSTGTGDMNNGIYFEYDASTSTNWLIKTASASSRTTTTTSTAVAADTWTRLRIEISTTSATFFIGGVNVGTISSDFPSGTSTRCSPIMRASRTAGLAVTYTFYVDYIMYKISFPTLRY